MKSRYDDPEYQKQVALQMLATPSLLIACRALVDLHEQRLPEGFKTWSKYPVWRPFSTFENGSIIGDLYTMKEFWEMARDGSISDWDGHANYANEKEVSNIYVRVSDTREFMSGEGFEMGAFDECPGATHVIWFNK